MVSRSGRVTWLLYSRFPPEWSCCSFGATRWSFPLLSHLRVVSIHPALNTPSKRFNAMASSGGAGWDFDGLPDAIPGIREGTIRFLDFPAATDQSVTLIGVPILLPVEDFA